MAGVPGADPGFEQVIQGILSTDNATRAAAEEMFKRVKGQPDVCVQQLMGTMEGSQQPDSRNLCAVLLRKVGVQAAGNERMTGPARMCRQLTHCCAEPHQGQPRPVDGLLTPSTGAATVCVLLSGWSRQLTSAVLQAAVKQGLLSCLQKEQNRSTLRKVRGPCGNGPAPSLEQKAAASRCTLPTAAAACEEQPLRQAGEALRAYRLM